MDSNSFTPILNQHSSISMTSKSMRKGVLYLIPISIGNSDKSYYQPPNNLKIISEINTFVVENARTARQYIKSVLPTCNISELTIWELDKHKEYKYPKQEVLDILMSGQHVGLMSEAGCPAVADPGHHVVADCHRAGVRVVPLVGPSSILLALMGAGFSGQVFTFHGYLPFDTAERRKQLLEIQRRANKMGETHIFIEAPYRNDKLLKELCEVLSPTTELCMAIDLTTEEEEIHRKSLSEWAQELKRGKTWHKRPAIFIIGR